jgi:hypothetical protein
LAFADWTGWLRKTVGSLRVKHPDLIEAIHDLDVPIATLNYDNLLTVVTGLEPITWRQADLWMPVIQRDDRAILHMHGYFRDPSSVVLGIRSYDAVLGNHLAQHLQQALASFHSLAFIGCSDAGTESSQTRRWRKADSNRWSHLRQRC